MCTFGHSTTGSRVAKCSVIDKIYNLVRCCSNWRSWEPRISFSCGAVRRSERASLLRHGRNTAPHSRFSEYTNNEPMCCRSLYDQLVFQWRWRLLQNSSWQGWLNAILPRFNVILPRGSSADSLRMCTSQGNLFPPHPRMKNRRTTSLLCYFYLVFLSC